MIFVVDDDAYDRPHWGDKSSRSDRLHTYREMQSTPTYSKPCDDAAEDIADDDGDDDNNGDDNNGDDDADDDYDDFGDDNGGDEVSVFEVAWGGGWVRWVKGRGVPRVVVVLVLQAAVAGLQ